MSLFDIPKDRLNPEIFDSNNKLLPEVRLFILKDIFRIMGKGNISGIYMLGSMAGYQYNENSDIDINLILVPGLDREDIKEYVKKLQYKILPGTNHEIGYYIQNYTIPKYNEAKYGVYNIIEDKWESYPPNPKTIGDPKKEFREELQYAKLFIKKYKTASKDEQERIIDKAKKDRKMAYWFSWGVPRESQQNILYKALEKAIGKRIEKYKP